MIAGSPIERPVFEELTHWVARARSPRLRSMLDFAEDEIVIPDGPFEGQPFRADRQPFADPVLRAMGYGLSNRRNRMAATGPTQTGKTLLCFVTPILFHLFEIGETVAVGVPDLDMVSDKWCEDLLPIIERTRYRDLLPRGGGGSRGGTPQAIRFRNGATLRFMTGGGGDKSRAAFTSRVLVITEVDGMDEASERSREADKVTQLEGRTRAWAGPQRRIYMECIVSTAEGRIWSEYHAGTESRLLLPCPHCGGFVFLQREHLVGWQEAASEFEAQEKAFWACPECGQAWSEDDRAESNRRAVLVHRGQEVTSDGEVVGSEPETATLGLHWTAVNNLFATAGDVGLEEWKAARADDEENAEKELCQFTHSTPYKPNLRARVALSAENVRNRTDRLPRGLVPRDTVQLTVGVDLGKWLAHYSVVAWRSGGRGHVCDYGVLEIDSDRLGSQAATLVALREFRDLCRAGWNREGAAPMVPGQVWIDSGWHETKDAVYEFCKESDDKVFRPCKGYGSTKQRERTYRHPDRKTPQIRVIGDQYHVARIQKDRIYLVHVNADHWKNQVHERFSMPIESTGALTVFHAPPNEHMKFSKHIVAEKQVVEFVPGRGEVLVWKVVSRANHWLDAMQLATAAGHMQGVRLVRQSNAPPPSADAPAETSWFAQQRKPGRR